MTAPNGARLACHVIGALLYAPALGLATIELAVIALWTGGAVFTPSAADFAVSALVIVSFCATVGGVFYLAALSRDGRFKRAAAAGASIAIVSIAADLVAIHYPNPTNFIP